MSEEVPAAEVRTVKQIPWRELFLTTRLWWLTIACLLLAVVLTALSLRTGGVHILVHFQTGHGVKPGAALRHRGIQVGEVTAVELREDDDGVNVQIMLEPEASYLAREGSRFWIERPQVGLARVSGLETVIGAKHLGVLPGDTDAVRAKRFTGLETPPLIREGQAVDIAIRFQEGYGLAAGDAVKHRGIVIGEVTSVELDWKTGGVRALARLVGGGQHLARKGSQFWIERPRLSLAEVRGLDTLVGGRYLAVAPGDPEAEPTTEFLGLENAPAGGLLSGGLEIVLHSPQRYGVESGSPVVYRGLRVGHVVSVGLASDSASIESRIFIREEYRNLVRDNTRFWSNSGVDMKVGLSGMELNIDTLAAIVAGGAAFATPEPPGRPVNTGHVFTMQKRPEEKWLKWEPRIALRGEPTDTGGDSRPIPWRVSLRWKERTLGIARNRQRNGWALPLEGGRLLGPADLLSPVSQAVDQKTILETAGRQWNIEAPLLQSHGSLAIYRLSGTENLPRKTLWWPAARLRRPEKPEDCFLAADPRRETLPVEADRLQADEESGDWLVGAATPLSEDWHGAAVVSVRDGAVLGVLLWSDGEGRIALAP